jgi:para-aminobenzoate synthetase
MRVLLIDNYDSFTYNLLHQLQVSGASCRVVRNDDERFTWDAPEVDVAVLSPGPETPEQAGRLMWFIQQYAGKLPMLGVCLGHQAIGMHFGASLISAPKPEHGKLHRVSYVADSIFGRAGDQQEVMRYHSLVLSDLPPDLKPLAYAPDGSLMAMRHRDLPLYGIQFHPESILTKGGQALIDAFLTHYAVY